LSTSLRPYEPLGMTTAKWREIEPVEVDLYSLVPSQEGVVDHILPANHSYCGDPVIHVVLFNGVMYISDGHNRVNEAKIRGEKTIAARLLVKLGTSIFQLNKVA
jgi:hypothetical protein